MKKYNLLFVFAGILLVSCSKEDNTPLSISPTSINCYAGDETQINILSGENVTFYSEDKFVAEVTEGGLVKAQHIGTTTIHASKSGSSAACNVSVQAKFNLFDEPVLDWSSTTESVIEKMGREPDEEKIDGQYYYMYYTVNSGLRVCYVFYNAMMLHDVIYELSTIRYTSEEVLGYAYERYLYKMTATASMGIYRFEKDQTCVVMVDVSSSSLKYTITYSIYL